MKKRFKKTLAQLQQIQGFAQNISSVHSGAGAIPALSQVATAFMYAGQFMTDMTMEPLIEELQDLLNNNGPQAQFYRRLIEVASTEQVDFVLAGLYPKQYKDSDRRGGLKTVLQGLIPNINSSDGIYASKYGELTIDVRPTDIELVNLIKNWPEAEKGVVQFDDGVVGIMSTMPPVNTTMQAARSWVVQLVDNTNKSTVTFNYYSHSSNQSGCAGSEPFSFGSSGVNDLDYQALRTILTNNFPGGHSYFNAYNNSVADQRPPLSFDCEVFNHYEGMSYPGTHDFISHQMLKKLMIEFLRVNHVTIGQDDWEHFLDDKLRYKTLIPLLHEHAHPGEVPMLLESDAEFRSTGTDRSYNDDGFYEGYVVDDVKDPTCRHAFVIIHHQQTPAGNGYGSQRHHVTRFTFKDDEKTCAIQVFSNSHNKVVNPTPRMIEYLTNEMLAARVVWLPKERERQEEAARNKAAYEERERKRIATARDAGVA